MFYIDKLNLFVGLLKKWINGFWRDTIEISKVFTIRLKRYRD